VKTHNENLNISYDQFEPDELFFVFAHNFMRAGLPTAMRQALEAAVDEQILHEMKDPECKIGYRATRSTYGKEQHLNYFEEFIVNQALGGRIRIYAEFANDPNHRIDATKNHILIDVDEKSSDQLMPIMSEIYHTYLEDIAMFWSSHADSISYVKDDKTSTIGLWFEHEHGRALVAVEIS
jgi:hypothetical protein